jgi:protein-L-isoaspartate O-methyltransferase
MRQGFCALLMVVILALPARGQDGEIDYGRARAMMVQMIQIEALLSSDVTGIDQIDARILEVMAEVPRHAFVPAELQPYAYGSHPLPVGHAQNLAAPFLVALMTHLADPKPGDVVFETGTGAGYHAAVLAHLIRCHHRKGGARSRADTLARSAQARRPAGHSAWLRVERPGSDGDRKVARRRPSQAPRAAGALFRAAGRREDLVSVDWQAHLAFS